ncbi:hypothetical protein [Glaciimonas sp. PCH181]|uniref:hypothetical protein n=1 Tax=Glaciimonas sp. PCH181 TaxID=2133943 RepID=UPI000D38BFCE|nr:hypothetical protein [Glaciimonas sp. PCH181]PUA19508.1 hypothetical protein C7W93_06520 [Glaciimonas sp. PCH181]
MTSLVFCRGCAHQIHVTATTCPQCGAPQLTANSPSEPTPSPTFIAPEIHHYADVPWFRKRWFAFVCFMFFPPAYFSLAFTGEFYFEKNGELQTMAKNTKFIWLGIFILLVLIRFLRD